MTSEEIKATIERLGAYCNSTYDVMLAFMGHDDSHGRIDPDGYKFKMAIIDLLRQADPASHMEMPVDADGVPIHVGDEVELSTGRTVWVEALSPSGFYYEIEGGYCEACHARHRKPTVEDVLVDYYEECLLRTLELGFVTNEDKEKVRSDIAMTFAEKIREVMADE